MMAHRKRDDDGWPVVTEAETWGEVIAAGLVLFLLVFALLAITFTAGAAWADAWTK